LIQLWYNAARPKTELSVFIDSMKLVIDQDYSKVIATLKTDWKRGHGESGIGNFIADAQREAVNADVSFMNPPASGKTLRQDNHKKDILRFYVQKLAHEHSR